MFFPKVPEFVIVLGSEERLDRDIWSGRQRWDSLRVAQEKASDQLLVGLLASEWADNSASAGTKHVGAIF